MNRMKNPSIVVDVFNHYPNNLIGVFFCVFTYEANGCQDKVLDIVGRSGTSHKQSITLDSSWLKCYNIIERTVVLLMKSGD